MEPRGILRLRPPFPSFLRVPSLLCFPLRPPSSGEPGGGSPISGHSCRCCRCVHWGSPVRLSRNPTVKLRIFQAPNFFNSHFGALFVNSSDHLVVGPAKKKKKKGKCGELAQICCSVGEFGAAANAQKGAFKSCTNAAYLKRNGVSVTLTCLRGCAMVSE